ncbi:MAG: S1 RNA-binding domain-containing protein [Fimbriimonadaceae bacterium]|nr:S1 RNA-binding domain-containing protein [Fimbriimonadaceae bacterium]
MIDEQLTPPGQDVPVDEPKPESEATPEPVSAEANPEVPIVAPSDPVPADEPAAPTPTDVPEPPAVAVSSETPVVAHVAPATSDADLFEAALSAFELGADNPEVEGGYRRAKRGEMVEATVVLVEKDRVFVNLGSKVEGIVPIEELTTHGGNPEDHVKVGDKINVVIMKPESGDGGAIVSKKRADFEDLWDRIEESFRDKVTLEAPVVDRVKGGLVVDIGVRGFVPATHVQSGKLRNIEKYVGQVMPFKIIEIDRERRKVVLSNKLAEDEHRDSAKDRIFNEVAPGDVLEGTVRRLTDYGAFVDLGGVDGLLHISEMSWARIKHPREMFKEGQDIKVMVLRLDKEIGKISLGHRQVLPDPWNLIRDNYRSGQKLTCTIGRIVQAGAFIALPEGAEAFLPLSEMSARRIRRPQDAIEEGQEVEVQIIDLKPDERRMVLSIRALGGEPVPAGGGAPGYGGGGYDDDRFGKKPGAKKKGAKGGRRDREDEDLEFVAGGRGRGFGTVTSSGGGATIGERLGMLKGFLRPEESEDTDESAEKEAKTEETDEE